MAWCSLALLARPGAHASDDPAWTALPTPEGARAVYVSSSQGDDDNSGASEALPKRTLRAARTLLRDRSPDRLLLKRGDAWDEPLTDWRLGGRDADAPMVIASYGAGEKRPIVRADHGHAFSRAADTPDVSHLAIVGVRFESRSDGAGDSAFWWLGGGQDLLVEDCAFDGGANGVVLQQGDSRLRDVRVRRCLVAGVGSRFGRPQGLYAWGVDGLLIEGVAFVGAHPDPGAPTGLISVGTDNTRVVVRDNLVVGSARDGIRVASGGLIEGNVVARCPRAVTLGGGPPDPLTHTLGVTGEVRDNVVLDCDQGIIIENIGARGARVVGNTLLRGADGAIILGQAPDSADAPPRGVGLRNVRVARNIARGWDVGVRVLAAAPGKDASGVVIRANQLSSCASALIDLNAPGVTLDGNVLDASNARAPVLILGEPVSPADWRARTGDDTTIWASPAYADPGRSLATYNASLGGAGTLDALLERALAQSRRSWDASSAPAAIGAYIRAGLAIPTRASADAP